MPAPPAQEQSGSLLMLELYVPYVELLQGHLTKSMLCRGDVGRMTKE